MIANLPDEVKATYEKMSGKRYRPLPASAQQQAGNSAKDRRAEMAYVPGMDGFNTIRYRGLGSAQGDEQEEEAPIPDIFYRCSVQGDQIVKTGHRGCAAANGRCHLQRHHLPAQYALFGPGQRGC